MSAAERAAAQADALEGAARVMGELDPCPSSHWRGEDYADGYNAARDEFIESLEDQAANLRASL